jgi:hypothetical protein
MGLTYQTLPKKYNTRKRTLQVKEKPYSFSNYIATIYPARAGYHEMMSTDHGAGSSSASPSRRRGPSPDSCLLTPDFSYNPALPKARSPLVLAAALAALLSCVFMLLWWDRFLAGTGVDGSFYYAARLILEGRIPYRDFNMSVPPLEALKVAGLVRLFGDYLILPRAWGLVERVALAAILCLWLGRFFRAVPAFLATMLGIIVFSSASADPAAGYNHSASFWAVAAGFAGSLLLDAGSTKAAWLRGGICGVCACLSFLTKQTTGFGVSLVIPSVIALAAWKASGIRRAVRLLLPYAAGWLVPFGLLSAWLLRNHALGAFLDSVFVHGPSSKGSLWAALLRPLTMTLQDTWLRQEALLTGVLLIGLALAGRFVHAAPRAPSSRRPVVAWFLAAIGALAAAAYFAATRPGIESRIPRLVSVPRIFLFAALFGGAAVFLFYTLRWLYALRLRRRLDPLDAQFWLFGGVSFMAAYMHSLSFVTTESMVLPGAAFLLAWALDHFHGAGRLASGIALALTALCFVGIFFAATLKLITPFAWYGWKDAPVSQASAYSMQPRLRGIRMSPQSAAFIDRLSTLVDAHSTPQQPIYAFYYLPLAYIVSDRDPATFAYIHFIDVASDSLALSDSQLLRQHPPAVIVYTTVTDPEIADWEKLFRGGRPSGQRSLISTLNNLVAGYRLLDTLQMPGSERPVKIYARN